MKMKKIMLVFGTRPEAIKMCPLVNELKKRNKFNVIVCVTGQHRQMLDQVLETFDIVPDYDLAIMKQGQTLFDITTGILENIKGILEKDKPDVCLVHGDTSTTFVTALACYYLQIPVGHVEAGLRTYNIYSPYPEEFNRQAVGLISAFNFAPTELARKHLLDEGKSIDNIFVTGNTVIDAMQHTVVDDYFHPELEWVGDDKMILITAHRRENLGEPMHNMFRAIRRVLEEHSNVKDAESHESSDSGILAELVYGTEKDWEKHYNYLLPFFKDSRYIKKDNRPIFSVFQPRNDIGILNKMAKYWNKLAQRDGFDGILFLSKDSIWPERLEGKMKYAPFAPTSWKIFIEYKIKEYVAKRKKCIGFYDYDRCWKNILFDAEKSRHDTYLCGFVQYDDSPRRGNKARIILNESPAKFEKYMKKLMNISKKQNKEFVFLMAWNEWGEGSYLEPDEKDKYSYLEALCAIAFILMTNNPISTRFFSMFLGMDGSYNFRWSAAVSTFSKTMEITKKWGMGLGNMNTASGLSFLLDLGIDYKFANSFLYFLTENGFLGFLYIVYLLLICIYACIKSSKSERPLRIGLLVFAFISQIAGGYFTDPILWMKF